jgi:hypothetical protein
VGKNQLATNAHVVAGCFADEIQVHFPAAGEQRPRPKRILYYNEVSDLCILEFDTDWPAIPLSPTHTLEPGERVVIIGNPSLVGGMMLRNAMSGGTLSALMHIDGYDFYQIDANVNPGSSGGPVLDHNGNLVAVVAMKATDDGEVEIREALQQLDADFAERFKQTGERQQGIAFGVPVSGVSHAMSEIKGQVEARTVDVNARHMAQTLFERMSLLGALYLLEMQVNAPDTVRQQALELQFKGPPARSSRLPKKKQRVELMPAGVASRIAIALQSERVRTLIRVYSNRLDERLGELRDIRGADDATVGHLAGLLKLVNQAERMSDHPPADYQRFSQSLIGLNDDIGELIEETAGAIEDDESAARR